MKDNPTPEGDDNPRLLPVEARSDDEPLGKSVARAMLRPTVQASLTLQRLSSPSDSELALRHLISELREQAETVANGNMGRLEAMLVAQCHTLDAIFNNLVRRAALNFGEYLNAAETYLRLALRAQSQSRANVETLAELKNPRPVAFVQQANIAAGAQQINNTLATYSPAGEKPNEQNKLLEDQNERMDARPKGQTKPGDTELASMGAIDRPPFARGKSKGG